jgi:hypothetical protein
MTGTQIKTELSRIIDSLVIDNNPQTFDDDQPDLLSDGEKRQEAIDQLQKMIEFYREML